MDTRKEPITPRYRSRRRAGLVLGLVAVVFMAIGSLAALSDAFGLDWWTVTSSDTMIGNTLRLSGSMGQADAGTMSGGTLRLSGGYWIPPVTGGAPGPKQYRVVLPTILGGP